MSCCRLSIYIILCYVILYNVILYNVIAYNVMYVIYVYVMCVIYVCVMLCDTSAIFLNLTWGSARLQYVSSMASGHPIWRAESQVSFKRTQCYIVLRRGRSEEVACLPEVPDGQDVLLLFKTILSRMCFFWCIYLLYCIYIYIYIYIHLSLYIFICWYHFSLRSIRWMTRTAGGFARRLWMRRWFTYIISCFATRLWMLSLFTYIISYVTYLFRF